jgi:hypothetical protein
MSEFSKALFAQGADDFQGTLVHSKNFMEHAAGLEGKRVVRKSMSLAQF